MSVTTPTSMAGPPPPLLPPTVDTPGAALAEKFEVTVMFTCDISVTESDVIQAFLRAVATKDFWLPGKCQVYAKALPPSILMERRHFNVAPILQPVVSTSEHK